MAGNVSGLHAFATDVGPIPLNLLDTNYGTQTTALNTLNNFANSYTDTGVVNALVVAPAAAQFVAYSDGLLLQVKVANTNTASVVTINVGGLGVRNIVNPDGSPLASGQLLAGSWITLQYVQPANQFQLTSGASQHTFVTLKVKAAATSRASTTVLSNDPDLVVTVPAAGTYLYELLVQPYQNGGGTVAIGLNLNYSAAYSGNNSPYLLDGKVAGVITGPSQQAVATLPTTLAFTSPVLASFPGSAIIRIMGVLVATGIGTLGFAWAQSASNVNPVVVDVGSYLKVTQAN